MGSSCSHHARHVVAHYGGNFAQFGQHRDVIFSVTFWPPKKKRDKNPRQFFLANDQNLIVVSRIRLSTFSYELLRVQL